MQRRWIFVFVAIAGFAGWAVADVLADPSLAVPALSALPLSSTPLPLDRDDPGVEHIGALAFRGAIQIRSSNALFGGLSALRAGRGDRMLALSDTGNWIAFDTVEQDGKLVGVNNAVIAPVLRPDGRAATSKSDGDCESLEWDAATGAATIVYEQDHRLVHFAGIDAGQPRTLTRRPVATERIAAMADWRPNGGGEAMAVLPGGVRIVIREDADADGIGHDAIVTMAAGSRRVIVTAPAGFSPTDAVALDASTLLVINRRFNTSGIGAALTLVDMSGIATASRFEARELARLQPPLTLDNMEGLALRRDGARVFVYIVSDDNLSSLQRTLLMKFELMPATSSRTAGLARHDQP